jgi:hypothetical protein
MKTKKLNIDKALKSQKAIIIKIEDVKYDNFPIYVLCAGMVVGMLLIWVLKSL